MENTNQTKWLKWVCELQAIAQIGITYCNDQFCHERYKTLLHLAAEITAEYSDKDFQTIVNLFNQESGYRTPKLDVRGAIIKDNKILLVKEKADHCWSLPGGWTDVNESPSEAITREIYEESGYQVKVTKLAALFDKLKHEHPPQIPHAYKCFFLCEVEDYQPKKSIEIEDVAFYAKDELPPLSLERVTASQIHRLFEHHQTPSIPTDFD